MSKVQYNNGSGFVTKYTYEYDGAGRLRQMYDSATGTRTTYSYDTAGRLLKSYNYKSGKILNATSYTYDAKSRVTSMVYSLDYIYDDDADAYAWTNTYTYDENTDLLSEMNISMSSLTATLTYSYDGLNMLDSKTAAFFHNGNAAFYNRVSYQYSSSRTSNVYKYKSETGRSSTGTLSTTEYNFTYDENGNITQITDANGVIQNKYYYDNLGQLIREDNRAKNKTYVWTYDNAGNRTSEKTYAFSTSTLGTVSSTKNYSYSNSAWGDLLTFDGRNYMTYDAIGNSMRM